MSEIKDTLLGEIGKVLMCKRVLKHQTSETYDIPFYKISTFGKQASTFISKKLYEEYLEKYSFPNKGDILISAAGTVGKTVIYDGSPAYFQDSNIVWIDNNESKIINSYLYYFYQTEPWLTTNGSTIKRIYNDNLRNIRIKYPSLNTQTKIATVLSTLDKKIALNNRINTELEAMAKTLYDYWFVQFDFPISEAQANALGKPELKGKPYKSSGGKMVFNEALKREIPEGWGDGSLFDLGDIVGGSTPSTKKSDNFSDDGIPWITPKDLSKNTDKKFISKGEVSVSEIGIKEASLKVYPKETVLLSSRAPIGYMAIARNPLTTNQGFKSFIPNKGYSTSFVYYTVKLSMKAIIQYSSGSTFKEISGTTLKTVKICLPPEYKAEFFTKKVKSMFERQDKLEQENQQLTQLRDWLLPMLMNGQVTVK